MKIEAANRTENVSSAIREIGQIAKEVAKQKKVISLNIGDPNKFDFDTPEYLRKEAIKALNGRRNYYADPQGEKEAVDSLVEYNNNLGIDTDNTSILVTFGVSEAVYITVASLVNPGENLLIPRPNYPPYSAYLNLFGCNSNFYTLNEEDEWDLDIEEIRKNIDDKTRGIVVINPNNPTGGLYSKNKLKEVVNIAGEHRLPIIADEIYDGMIIEGDMHHIAAFSGDVPVITYNGLAKNFLAPGWRTGWMVFTDRNHKLGDVKEACMRLARVRLCATTAQQCAIKAALEHERDHQDEALEKLRSRRNLVYRRINEIEGLSLAKPKATFYSFPRIDFEINDRDFVVNLLKEEGVAVVHGSGFEMPHHFRLIYLAQEDVLNEALDKIERFVKSLLVKAVK